MEFWGDEVERISKIDPLTGDTIAQLDQFAIYPAKHFVTERPKIERAVREIRTELAERLAELKAAGKLLEAQGWSRAPISTSRCCWRWGPAPASRTTPPAERAPAASAPPV